jgi:hypothetical protein
MSSPLSLNGLLSYVGASSTALRAEPFILIVVGHGENRRRNLFAFFSRIRIKSIYLDFTDLHRDILVIYIY